MKPGDMFLLWAQQWYYIMKALQKSKNVLRADCDVYFAEDPYPILKGPLFGQFNIISQVGP